MLVYRNLLSDLVAGLNTLQILVNPYFAWKRDNSPCTVQKFSKTPKICYTTHQHISCISLMFWTTTTDSCLHNSTSCFTPRTPWSILKLATRWRRSNVRDNAWKCTASSVPTSVSRWFFPGVVTENGACDHVCRKSYWILMHTVLIQKLYLYNLSKLMSSSAACCDFLFGEAPRPINSNSFQPV